jgi:hypothetical protein
LVYECFYRTLALQEQHPLVAVDRPPVHDAVRAHPHLAVRVVHIADVA